MNNRKRVERICLSNLKTIDEHAWELTDIAMALGVDAGVSPRELCKELTKGKVSNALRGAKQVSLEAAKEAALMIFKKLMVKYCRSSLARVFGVQAALRFEASMLTTYPMLLTGALFGAQMVGIEPVQKAVMTALTATQGFGEVIRDEQMANQIVSHVQGMSYVSVMNAKLAKMYPSLDSSKPFNEAALMLVPSFSYTRNSLSVVTGGGLTIPDVVMQSAFGRSLYFIQRGDYLNGVQGLMEQLFQVLNNPSGVAGVLSSLMSGVYQIALTHAVGSVEALKARGLSYVREVLSELAAAWAGPLYYVVFVLTTVGFRVSYHALGSLFSRAPRRKYLYTFNLTGSPASAAPRHGNSAGSGRAPPYGAGGGRAPSRKAA